MSQTHNLDESVQEYFEFTLFGKRYKFRHLNTSEAEELQKKTGSDTESFKIFLTQFVSKVDQDAPEFSDVVGKMITPHWRNFNKMIKEEFAG